MSLEDVRPQLIAVEEEMVQYLEGTTTDEQLKASMLYSISAGGKRIRPLLLLSTYALYFPTPSKGVFQAAAAVEMIHTYSLIHDDLPAMDDDDLRRGKPTNHKVYGEALAILAGDGLLTMSFDLLAHAELEDDKKIKLLQLLARTSGAFGMVAGQASDVQSEDKLISLSELQSIHQRKTGELIRYALLAGGILGGSTAEELDLLTQLAKHLGLAFQIRDDLLDVISTTEELGKQIHRDEALEKSTYPKLLGLEGTKKALKDEIEAANQILQMFSQQGLAIQALVEIVSLFDLKKED